MSTLCLPNGGVSLTLLLFYSPKKYMCMSRRYASDTHQVTTVAIRSEQMCNYDLDDMDLRWLSAVNGERALMGATTISELEMEKGIEDFEKQCYEKINITLRNNEAQEDQDDSIICDVCRSVTTNTVQSCAGQFIIFTL